jgi:uncharacterized protein
MIGPTMPAVVDFLRKPQWHRQHWRRAVWRGLSRVGLTGLHVLPLHQDWVEVVRLDMPFKHLDPAFEGLRIAHISDLHYSPFVAMPYLMQTLQMVDELRPDLIVATGDLITGGRFFAKGIAKLLASLRPRLGTIAIFGNHDYTMFGKDRSSRGRNVADTLEREIEAAGVTVLRNEQIHLLVDHAKHPLVIVGLDDIFSDHQDAKLAFTQLHAAQPILCLNHDPANAKQLLQYPWQWMLSGHTHGRAIENHHLLKRMSLAKPREFVRGHYELTRGKQLYVNRGIAYGQSRDRHCLPEITLFTLRAGMRSSGVAN